MSGRLRDRLPSRPVVSSSLAVAATLPGDSLMYAVLPVVYADLGLELWMVGVLLSANRFVRLASNPFAGWWVDRFGTGRAFKASVFASAVITAAYAVPGFAVLFVARLGWGVCWSFLRLGAYLACLANSDERTRGVTFGFSSGLVSLGTMIAMAFAGLLTDSIGFAGTVAGFAVLPAVAGLLFVREDAWREAGGSAAVQTATASVAATETLAVGRARRLGVYGIAAVNAAAGSGVVVATIGLLLVERFGDPVPVAGLAIGAATLSGLMLALRFASTLLLSPLGGRISDGVGRIATLVVSAAAVVVCLLALSWSPGSVATLGITAVLFLSATVVRVSLDASAGDVAPEAARARVMAAYANATDVGSALGPFAAYPAAQAFGLPAVYQGCALLMAVAFGVGVLVVGRART